MTSARHIVVAVNPAAAFGKHRAAGGEVVAGLEAAGHRVSEVHRPNFELLRQEVEQVLAIGTPRQADALVVVGGDGMVSLGVNLVAETGIPLGIVPAGTGNDMARGLGIPLGDVGGALRIVLDALGSPRVIDAAQVRHGEHMTWWVSVFSAGFDAKVNERTNRMTWPKSAARYTIATLLELLPFRAPEYTLTVEGQTITQRAMLIAVGNNTSIGGGMRLLPHALLDDGVLEVIVADTMPKLRLLRIFPKVFAGAHGGEPEVHFLSGRQVRIEGPADVIGYADGERVGPLPVDLEIVAGALRVLAPQPVAERAEDGDDLASARGL